MEKAKWEGVKQGHTWARSYAGSSDIGPTRDLTRRRNCSMPPARAKAPAAWRKWRRCVAPHRTQFATEPVMRLLFKKTCMQGALEARPGRASLTSLLLSRRARLLPTLDHAAIADGIFSSVYGCPLEACTGVRRFVSVSTPPAFRHFRNEPLPQFTARICGGWARRGWCNGDYCSQTPDRAVWDDGMRV